MKKRLGVLFILISSCASATNGPSVEKNLESILNETPQLDVTYSTVGTVYAGGAWQAIGKDIAQLSFTTKGLTSVDIASTRTGADGSEPNKVSFVRDDSGSVLERIATRIKNVDGKVNLTNITRGVSLSPVNGNATLPQNFNLIFSAFGASPTLNAGNYTAHITITSNVL
ncbi:TPA: hypothetical protein LTX70_004825 [Escherichia coli]|uniref:hypothetical protein n=1 Tax=Escherichia coli TaxID=562 RepID=UPI003797D1F4|nr:hypothetical protein [Escherichia coli]